MSGLVAMHAPNGAPVDRELLIAMTAAQRASIHGVDEWVTIDSLERGERFHRALITAIPE